MDKKDKYIKLCKEKSSLIEETKIITQDILEKRYSEEILKSSNLSDDRKSDLEKKVRDDIVRVTKKHGDRLEEIQKSISKIDNKIVKLKKDDSVKQLDSYFTLKKSYKEHTISKDILDNILRKINTDNKVHYSDVIVYNSYGKILLLKRSNFDSSNPEKWCVPGGHVDPGEEHIDAASRELWEESGILKDTKDLNLLGVYSNEDVVIHYYTCYMEDEEPTLVLDEAEAQDYLWVNIHELATDKIQMPFNMKENLFNMLGYPQEKVKVILDNMDRTKSSDLMKSKDMDMVNTLSNYMTKIQDDEFAEFVQENEGDSMDLIQKSLLIDDFEDLKKNVGHKYIDKKPDGKGGWKYIYDEPKSEDDKKKDSDKLKNVLKKVESEIVKLDYEHAYCFDKDGNELFNVTQKRVDSVNIPDKYKDKLDGSIYLHNHPKANGFSLNDINICFYNKVKIARVCVKDGKYGDGSYVIKNNLDKPIDLNNYIDELRSIYKDWFEENAFKENKVKSDVWINVFSKTNFYKENKSKIKILFEYNNGKERELIYG